MGLQGRSTGGRGGEAGDETVQENGFGESPLWHVKELRLRAMGGVRGSQLHSGCSAQNGRKGAALGERGCGQPSRRDDSGLNRDSGRVVEEEEWI